MDFTLLEETGFLHLNDQVLVGYAQTLIWCYYLFISNKQIKKTKKVLRPSFQELICNREAIIELLIFVITDTLIMIL